MTCFGFGELYQKLSHRGIARIFRCPAVVALRLEFHVLGKLAYLFEAERPREPKGLFRMKKAFDVLAADQRQVVSKLLAIEIEQHRAVMHFLFGHLVEYFCRSWELLAQTFRTAAIDAALLLFVCEGECQNFVLAEIGKPFHAPPRCHSPNVLWHIL